MSDKSGIAQINQPIELTWNNRRVRTKEDNEGQMFYFVELEIDAETWAWMQTVPRTAMGEMVFWITEIGKLPEKKPRQKKPPKEPAGPHNHFWSRLIYVDHFAYCAGVKETIQQIINANPDIMEKPLGTRAHEALRRFFKVEHLSTVSPEQAIEAFENNPAARSMISSAKGWLERHPPGNKGTALPATA